MSSQSMLNSQMRIALLRDAQQDLHSAIAKIKAAVLDTAAEDRANVYTLLWLSKALDSSNEHADIGNIDELVHYLDDDQ